MAGPRPPSARPDILSSPRPGKCFSRSLALYFLLSALVTSIASCGGPRREAPSALAASPTSWPTQLQGGQVIVTLRHSHPVRMSVVKDALAAIYGLRESGTFPLRSIGADCVVFLVPNGQSSEELVQRLRADPRVDAVEENQVFQLRAGDPRGLTYGPALIRADAVHRSSTGRGVKVAMIDTGVAYDHPALRGRIALMENFVVGGEGDFAHDRHGTAVAGVIGAHGGGVLGIAPDAEIIALKACWYPKLDEGKALCSSWTIAKALEYAIEQGAQVLNLSLSGPPDELLGRLIEAAHSNGVLTVAAAEERGPTPGFPASMPGVIAVLASDARGEVELPSWTAKRFAVAAPGVDILTTVPEGRYDFMSGSSLAAAHVSGVVALLLQERPRLTPQEALEILEHTARPIRNSGPGSVRVAGLVDACAALGRVMALGSCPQ
jgi:subtilisin family serine protease